MTDIEKLRKTTRDLAESIVDDLMTAGNGDRAVRLVLEYPGVSIRKYDLGGYCREAAIQQVCRTLGYPQEGDFGQELPVAEFQPAFHYYCEHCAASNFVREKRVEMTPEEHEAAVRRFLGLEDWQPTPNADEQPIHIEAARLPDVVHCSRCGKAHRAAFDDAPDTETES